MSYTTLCKQWERESKKRDKERREERKRQQERENEFKFQIYLAKDRQEKQEQKEREEKQIRLSIIKDNILLALQKSNPFTYRQYLIIWDVIHYNYSQILHDFSRSRITKEDITKAIDFIKSFSSELIPDYWQETLITA